MKLKDFCIRKGWALTYAKVRYDLASEKVLVNSEVPENEDVMLEYGDIVSYGKHRVETVSIRDFIEIDGLDPSTDGYSETIEKILKNSITRP